MSHSRQQVTELLVRWSEGDAEALERLMPLVFDELRRLAQSHLRREPGSHSHTLQPTALVNEIYMRLVDQRRVQWQSRAQFFAFAATLMRRILVDHAKAKQTDKRGGGVQKISLHEGIGTPAAVDIDLIALDQALNRLEKMDPTQAQIVVLRFFAGLNNKEIAEAVGISRTTVKREWTLARLWLFRELGGGGEPDEGPS
jgi:RNA polymerase sigma factor (TIGR02999 family)